MGVHEAYHVSSINRWIHWICIPLELWGVLKLAALVKFGGAGDLTFDLGLGLIVILAPIFLAVDVLGGLLMALMLLGLWASGKYLFLDMPWSLGSGLVAFVVPFLIQTKVGHVKFEPDGRDDTDVNIREFKNTKNPIPLILIFFYHLMQVLFALGYRKRSALCVKQYRDEHMQPKF